MADKTLSLPGISTGETAAHQREDGSPSRFDPQSYFTTVHVPGYNVLTSVAAAKRRQARWRKSQALRAAVGASSVEPHGDAVAKAEPESGDPRSNGRHGNALE
jgi:hypothetical protein